MSSSGLVGIGVAAPKAHLDITDQNWDGLALIRASPIKGNPFVVNTNGWVGINNANPQYPLDVIGGGSFSEYIKIGSYAWVSGGITVGSYVSSNAPPAGGMILSGSVGIGTPSPQAALDVQGGVVRIGAVSVVNPQVYAASNTGNPGFNGYSLYVQYGVLAESFKCAASGDPSNWSDYVFDKDYKLKSLSELEGYIKDHHHLPDVPSADDVACDGIDMANMDATLLKKIEELTLYVLDLKKDNEAIKKDNAAMKAQLSNLIK